MRQSRPLLLRQQRASRLIDLTTATEDTNTLRNTNTFHSTNTHHFTNPLHNSNMTHITKPFHNTNNPRHNSTVVAPPPPCRHRDIRLLAPLA